VPDRASWEYGARVRELVLVRHGETVGQSSIRLYGATDVALSPEGEDQAAAVGRALHGRRFDAVFTSPLCRARRSAELVLEAIAHPAVELEIVADFREIDFGEWEGWTWPEVQARDPAGHARWASEGPAFRFPGGEARRDFVTRVQAAVPPSIGARFESGAEQILAVLHKGVIKAITAHLLERPMTELDGLALPLGAIRLLRFDERWRLEPDPSDHLTRNIARHQHEELAET
jgi:broad specificity phosphatase PhoE